MPLPTEKTSPSITPATAKTFLYGPPGIGKTTLGAKLHPDAMVFATEPGTGGIEAFVQPINSWQEFLHAGKELIAAREKHPFVVIDTADELQRMCQEHVMKELRVAHPSDLGYGKGWDALSREWRRIAGFVRDYGGGVMFTSHAKETELEAPVGKYVRSEPTLTGAAAKWLLGFCEFVLFATFLQEGETEHRVLRTQPSKFWLAKSRAIDGRQMADPVLLEAKALRKAMHEATTPETEKPAPKKAGTKKKAEPEPAAA